MKLVGALLGDDVVDGAHHVAVLGRRAERQHLDFLDRVGIRLRKPLAEIVVGHVHAVELEGVFVERAPKLMVRRSPAAVPSPPFTDPGACASRS